MVVTLQKYKNSTKVAALLIGEIVDPGYLRPHASLFPMISLSRMYFSPMNRFDKIVTSGSIWAHQGLYPQKNRHFMLPILSFLIESWNSYSEIA